MTIFAPMKRAGGIVWICVPFVAGAGCSALLGELPGQVWPGLTVSFLIACLFAVSCVTDSHEVALMAVLYFLLGVFCHRNALCIGYGLKVPQGITNLMDRFARYVRSVPFGSQDTGDLLTALLTGNRRWIARSTVTAFRQAGAAHILALSGLHLGVLASVLRRALALMGNSRPAAFVRSLAIIAASGIYTVLCGMGPSILRAFFFITLREISSHYHARSMPGVNVLCTACLLHLALDPLAIGSLSFQLSYLAVASLIVVNPCLSGFFDIFRQTVSGHSPAGRTEHDGRLIAPLSRWLWNSISMSLSCQLFTAPLVWARFHTFPRYFLLTNIIALPLTEIFIPLGLLCVVLYALGLDWPLLYSICDSLCSLLTESLAVIASM